MGARERQQRYRHKNPHKVAQQRKKYRSKHGCKKASKPALVRKRCRRHGLSVELYEFMLREQEGLCDICKNPETREGWPLSIDHDHATGHIRGLLCHKCNKMLGLAKDSVLLLESAIKYLKEKGNCYVH